MPPNALSTPLRAWRCPSCRHRAFTTTPQRQDLGPEHPNYIPIPQPPQPDVPRRPFIKGRLPVPRDVFAGSGTSAKGDKRDKASQEWLDRQTKPGKKTTTGVQDGRSRQEWKARLTDMRKRNLREGLTSLRARKERDERIQAQRAEKNRADREAALHAPERSDDRLTAPSHGLDVARLMSGKFEPEDRLARITQMQSNITARAALKKSTRQAHLNTLYMNARHFITTPAQLDAAVDEAFGTPERPVVFGDLSSGKSVNESSVWAYGRPERVQDMINRANNTERKTAMAGAGGFSEVNAERIRRIAEVFTGGRMEGQGAEEARR